MRLLILVSLFVPVQLSAEIVLMSPRMEELRNEGFHALYNLNYDKAEGTFEEMTRIEPKHPAGHLYLANIVWQKHLSSIRRLQTGIYSRSDAFFSETDEDIDSRTDRLFRERIARAISLSEEKLSTDRGDLASTYFLGAAQSIQGAYDATIKRSFFSALRAASGGVKLHRKILQKDPTFADAALSVGAYEYVMGSLPFAVKVLLFFGGVQGSRSEGLRILERVAKEGTFARDEASVALVVFYNREKRHKDALKHLNLLTTKYSENSLLRLEKAATLAESGKFAESDALFEAMLQDPNVMAYIPDFVPYRYATALFDRKSWQKAEANYRKAIESEKAPQPLITLCHLGIALCLDAQGKRDEAVSEYRVVLKRKDTMEAHDVARKNLKEPFEP